MNFYVIANYWGDQNLTFEMLKQFYDISYYYSYTTSGLTQDVKYDEIRIESRLCTQDDFGWNDK